MELTYRSNCNIVYSCKYHVVWCPKYRRKILSGKIESRVKQIVKDVCNDKNADLIEIECNLDHIHILVDVDPQFGIHKLVKQIKGRSAFILRSEFPFLKSTMPNMWTNSYFVSTVGGAPLSVVKQYIENQKLRTS
jgi:putative transposase